MCVYEKALLDVDAVYKSTDSFRTYFPGKPAVFARISRRSPDVFLEPCHNPYSSWLQIHSRTFLEYWTALKHVQKTRIPMRINEMLNPKKKRKTTHCRQQVLPRRIIISTCV